MFEFLPQFVLNALKKVPSDKLREIRLRLGDELFVNCDGKITSLPLGKNRMTKEEFEKILLKITEHSVYAHTETLKNGYITTNDGVRVGFCGKTVVENEQVIFIKEPTSLCIRVPHEIVGCSDTVFKRVFTGGLASVLVISPPAKGKTTLIRDLVRNISQNLMLNVLVVDERGEISGNGRFNLGKNTDVLLSSPKKFGLSSGVRSLNPDVIAVDELMNEKDAEGVEFAKLSGVEVIATIHSSSILDVQKKKMFSSLFQNKIFDYAVVLSEANKPYEVVKI